MSTLPENNIYSKNASSVSGLNFGNLAKLTQDLQKKTAQTSSDTFTTGMSQFMNPGAYLDKGKPPKYIPDEPTSKAYVPGDALVPAAPGRTADLPEGYNQWDMTDAWGKDITTTPTDPFLRNYPGGGQYVEDKTRPGVMIKSARVIMDDKINPGARRAILGDLSPAIYEVDHIVPLWAGGGDTLSNLQALNLSEHQKKTATQAVALTLLRNRKITEREALTMAMDWKDRDIRKLPSIEEVNQEERDRKGNLIKPAGQISLKTAEKIQKAWIDDATKPIGLLDHKALKYFGESFRENMSSFGSSKMLGNLANTFRSILGMKEKDTSQLSSGGIPVVSEFAKGLAGSTGLAPGSEATPESGVLGQVSNFAGNLVGMTTGMKFLGKGIAGGSKLLGLNKAAKIADTAADSIGLFSKGTAGIKGLALKEQLSAMAAGAGLFGVWGQITQTNRNLTDQEEFSLKGHMNQFFQDAMFGGATAGWGQSVKGYLGVGLSTTALSLMLAPEGEANIKDALTEGATMAGLHLLGLQNTKFKAGGAGSVYAQKLEQIAKGSTMKRASVALNQGSKDFPLIMEKGKIPEVYSVPMDKANAERIKIEEETGLKRPEITTTDEYIKLHAEVNFLAVDAKKDKGLITEEQWKAERKRIAVAADMMSIYSLPIGEQAKAERIYLNKIYTEAKAEQDALPADVKEKKSIFAKKPNTFEIRAKQLEAQIPTEVYRNIPKDTDILDVKNLDKPVDTSTFTDLIEANVPGTGYGKKPKTDIPINPTYVSTINDYNASLVKGKDGNGKTFLKKAYITNDKTDYELSSRIAQDAKGDTAELPGRNLRVWLVEMVDGKPVFREAASVPREQSFNAKEYPLNAPFTSSMTRLKSVAEKGTTEEEVLKLLNADKQAGLKITPDQAKKIFENKGKIKSLSDLEFYKLIKNKGDLLPQYYDPKFNNRTIGDQMERMKSTLMEANINKAYRVDEQGRKRTDPKNPFLEIGVTPEGAVRGAEMSNRKEVETILNGIKDIAKKEPKTKKEVISKTMKDILKNIYPTKKPSGRNPTKKELIENKEETRMKDVGLATQQSESKKMSVSAGELKKMIDTPTSAPIDAPIKSVSESTDAFSGLVSSIKKEKIPDPGQFTKDRRGEEGINQTALANVKKPKDRIWASRKGLTEIAKKASEGGETRDSIIKGWDEFYKTFVNNIKEAPSGEPNFKFKNKDDINKLASLYVKLARSNPRNEIIFSDNGIEVKKGGIQNFGNVDIETRKFNKENNLQEDSMEVVHLGKKNEYTNSEGEFTMSSGEKLEGLLTKMDQAFNKNGEPSYVPLGIPKKGLDSIIMVKYEPKMVEKFDKDPNRYLNEGEKIEGSANKFVRAYLVDVLKMPKNIKDADFVKRANLIFHRYDQYQGPQRNINLRILSANKIGDEKSFNIDKSYFESPESDITKKAVEGFHGGKIEDGIIYMEKSAWDAMIKGFGYEPKEHVGSLKALIDSSLNGQKTYHKGQFQLIDDAIAKHLKETRGITVNKNDVFSFDSNAKIGPKSGDHIIPMSDIFGKSRSTADSISKESSSYERKFYSTDPKVKEEKMKAEKEKIKTYTEFNNDLKQVKDKKSLDALFDKYKDIYHLEKEDLFQGTKKGAYDLGASRYTLAREVEKINKNIFMDSGINPEYKNSTMVTIVAPIKADYDGNGKSRYVNNKEIVIGKEQMEALGVKEGDEVVVHRDPSYDINNMLVLKVVDGTKTGNTSLSKENGMVSSWNERTILQGDQDADTMHITKIGEGGISKPEADAIKKRGGLATPFTEVNLSETNYTTADTIKEKIKDQLIGDDQTSWISSQARIMDEVKDNNITIKVYKEKDPERKSRYEIYSNGKKVDSGSTKNSPVDFTATPKWTDAERQIISQAQREAVDSKKSNDIYNKTKGEQDWAIKQLWDMGDTNLNPMNKGGSNLLAMKARALNGALKKIQQPYKLKAMAEEAGSVQDILKGKISSYDGGAKRDVDTGLTPTIDYYKNLKNGGVELTPLQEKLTAWSEVDPLYTEQKMIVRADNYGRKEVREKITDININDVKRNENTKEVLKKFGQMKSQYNYKKRTSEEKKKLVEDFNIWFEEKLTNEDFTPRDLDYISYWAAESRESNLKDKNSGGDPTSIYRNFDLINVSPRIAEVYYNGAESATPFPTGPKQQSSPIPLPSLPGDFKELPEIVKNKKKDDVPDDIRGMFNKQQSLPLDNKGGPISGKWSGTNHFKMPDGQGGMFGDAWQGIKNMGGNIGEKLKERFGPITYNAADNAPSGYNIRGMNIQDNDLKEASNILYGEISNRDPESQKQEIRHIVNTAINRGVKNPKGFGNTLTGVLQKPYQYQSYAPNGITDSSGKTVESQYQKISRGATTEWEKKKLNLIIEALNEIKSGKFDDTTGGKMFYVHASDGTLWLGSTVEEAKKLAQLHEKQGKLKKTPFGTRRGLPSGF